MNTSHLTRIVLLAKAPVAGCSKTRLTPSYTPTQAAAIAEACLRDTLDSIYALTIADNGFDALVSLDGAPGAWLPSDMPVLAQGDGGHDIRIARAMEQSVQPAGRQPADAVVLIGMDTPQLTPELLRDAAQLTRSADSAFGPAHDGGWWLLGLRRRHALRARDFVLGVPMSTSRTGELQRQRLRRYGLSIETLPTLRDIDTAEDLEAVLHQVSQTEAATHLTRLARRLHAEAAA
jgi:glycosyltransferase A (GT-A) superfamily protein (DUF2064 family)